MAFMTNDPKKAAITAMKHKQFADGVDEKRSDAKKRTARVHKTVHGPRKVLNTLEEIQSRDNVNHHAKKSIEKAIRRKIEKSSGEKIEAHKAQQKAFKKK